MLSKAKSTRLSASSCNRSSMIRPAAIPTSAAPNADSPCAITSAFTKSETRSVSRRSAGASVDFPAPFGPAIKTTLGSGFWLTTSNPTALESPSGDARDEKVAVRLVVGDSGQRKTVFVLPAGDDGERSRLDAQVVADDIECARRLPVSREPR